MFPPISYKLWLCDFSDEPWLEMQKKYIYHSGEKMTLLLPSTLKAAYCFKYLVPSCHSVFFKLYSPVGTTN